MRAVQAMTGPFILVLLAASSATFAQTASQGPSKSAATPEERNRATESLKAKGESRAVAREYEVQARSDPADPAPKVRAALIYESVGDLVAADTAAREALKLDVNSVDALLVLGRIAVRQQEWSAAAAYFRQVAALKPNHAAAQLDLGQALEKTGDPKGSDDAYATYRSLRGLPPLQSNEKPGPR
jgi:Flp pilus assembly protein TadD